MQQSFSFLGRDKIIQNLKTNCYDLVIVGGGITGSGVARDAASRGMKVALIEADDFSSGTSSRSSKLIHGGIRYLENLEFHLVFEALSERKLLFDMAPHLVHPLRFLLPIYENDRVGMFKMGLGMWLYDILSLFDAPEMHERLNDDLTMDRIPILKHEKLKGSFVYSDAYMDDDRLCLETLRSAQSQSAHCVNFVKATSAVQDKGKISKLSCTDVVSGEKFEIQGKHFVSTVGPWTDIFGESLFSNWKKIMRPSKGIHITLNKKRFPLECAVVMATGKRIVFGIPRHEMVIVGTTDTDFSGNPSDVHSDEADIEYVLKVVDSYFPGAKLKEEDIIASYAGVRPLIHDGSDTESKTSREHIIINDDRNVTFVAGGKYTTYRRMAEQTVDKILKKYFTTEERIKFMDGQTKCELNSLVSTEKFTEAHNNIPYYLKNTHLSETQISMLVSRHGLEVENIFNAYLKPDTASIWELEADFAMDNTMCGRLLDFYLRRTPLFLAEPDHGRSILDRVGQRFSEKLNWPSDRLSKEKELLMEHQSKEMSWRITN